jgi:hypothetical protein
MKPINLAPFANEFIQTEYGEILAFFAARGVLARTFSLLGGGWFHPKDATRRKER